jgi:hypothetical protein
MEFSRGRGAPPPADRATGSPALFSLMPPCCPSGNMPRESAMSASDTPAAC